MKKNTYCKKRLLQRKLSSLVELAIHDMKKVEKMRGYRINMIRWHEPFSTDDGTGVEVCAVCAAGSVMARTLGVPKDQYAVPTPRYFSIGTNARLDAINCLRCGDIANAMICMVRPRCKTDEEAEDLANKILKSAGCDSYFYVSNFSSKNAGDDIKKFYADMESLAAYLKSKGL